MLDRHQEYLAWTYFSEDALDKPEFERLGALLFGTKLFIDVGASHGVYTYHANRFLHDADIIAIEADPQRFAVLKSNVEKWSAGSSNRITCINAAVSDAVDAQAGEGIEFFVTGTQISGGLFSVPERSDDYAPTKVPVMQLDELYRPGTPTTVKIDVEGVELRVLQGATRLIASGKATFLTEFSWWGDRGRGTSSVDVLRFSTANGLRVDRRLRSDYLLTPEPRAMVRAWSAARCLPPLVTRAAWNRFAPQRIRRMRERRLNARRLARFHPEK
jgi:FkbM family methyltransferase